MKTGIYSITQQSTGIAYVGSAVNIVRRWHRHRSELRKGKHHCLWFQRSWSKYGEGDFVFAVIEELDDVEQLIERERFWIAQKGKTFNSMLPDIDRPVFVHSAESKSRMSHAQKARFAKSPAKPISPEQRAVISAVHKGRKASDEARRKMSAAAKMRPPVTEETKEKLRQANYKRTYSPLSDEQKEKLRIAHTGKTLTPEHRMKISQSLAFKWKAPS